MFYNGAKPHFPPTRVSRSKGTAIAWLPAAVFALTLTVASQPSSAQPEPLEYDELRALIEINATDGDAGFHFLIDAAGWKEVRITDPDGKKIYKVQGTGGVGEQGLTENFFESAEPSCADVPLATVLDRFPEGEYLVTGKSIDQEKLEGETELTHALPGAPETLAPDQIGGVSPAAPVMITWTPGDTLGNCPPDGVDLDPVDLDPAPGDVPLFGFQVVVGQEAPDPFVEFIIEVPAGVTSVTIPPEFLQMDAIYKYEVVAIEDRDGEKGNQTISESFFCTDPIATVDCQLP